MDYAKRLELIIEAIRYCQRMKAMGMPASCYAKTLRETVFFLWDRRDGKTKIQAATFRSVHAKGLKFGNRELVYDHSIPFRILQDELLLLQQVDAASVEKLLKRYCVAVLITPTEDARLTKAGLNHKMPDDWDGKDAFARYKAVGIKLIENQ